MKPTIYPSNYPLLTDIRRRMAEEYKKLTTSEERGRAEYNLWDKLKSEEIERFRKRTEEDDPRVRGEAYDRWFQYLLGVTSTIDEVYPSWMRKPEKVVPGEVSYNDCPRTYRRTPIMVRKAITRCEKKLGVSGAAAWKALDEGVPSAIVDAALPKKKEDRAFDIGARIRLVLEAKPDSVAAMDKLLDRHSSRPKATVDLDNRALEMLREGKDWEQVRQDLGLTKSSLRRLRNRIGVPPSPALVTPPAPPPPIIVEKPPKRSNRRGVDYLAPVVEETRQAFRNHRNIFQIAYTESFNLEETTSEQRNKLIKAIKDLRLALHRTLTQLRTKESTHVEGT